MRLAPAIAALAGGALLMPSAASASGSVGSYEQVEWVRRAAANFVTAELRGDGAGACSILTAPLRTRRQHRTCAQRWSSKLARLRRVRGARALLRRDAHAIASATVIVHGERAVIELPAPLMGGPNRFLWTENCWMLAA